MAKILKPAIRVAIVEDDPEIRKALSLLIADSPGFRLGPTYGDAESAIKGLREERPDVVLMDIQLPGLSGIDAVIQLRATGFEADIIMLTVHKDDEKVFRSLCAGANGYLLKTTRPDQLIEAIREAASGGAPMSSSIARMIVGSFRRSTTSPLTERETDVLTRLCKGDSYKMIADTLFLAEETVHHHIKSIYRKLEVHSKSEAVAMALQKRLV